jgi:hypothetical protein
MIPRSHIPEVANVFALPRCSFRSKVLTKGRSETALARRDDGYPGLHIAAPRVQLYRPLLNFSKDRLIATCRASNTPWVEDPTNHDSTLTMRNAIRQVLAQNRLPHALRHGSMLNVARLTARKARTRDAFAERLWNQCEIPEFDLRSGRLVVRLPRSDPSAVGDATWMPLHDHSPSGSNRVAELQHHAARVVKRLLALVAPREDIGLANLQTAVEAMFPDIRQGLGTQSSSSTLAPQPSSFTLCGVLVTRLGDPVVKVAADGSEYLSQGWALSRAPYEERPDGLPRMDFPGRRCKGPAALSQLYDGRYWVHIYGNRRLFSIRPYRPADQKPFLASLPTAAQSSLRQELKLAAPGKVRWTLPAITNDQDQVVALPTFGYASPAYKGVAALQDHNDVFWQVSYRKLMCAVARKETDQSVSAPGSATAVERWGDE